MKSRLPYNRTDPVIESSNQINNGEQRKNKILNLFDGYIFIRVRDYNFDAIEDYTYDPDFDSQTLGTIERKHAGSWTKAIGGGRITPHPKST